VAAHCQLLHGASDFNRCCGVWVQNLVCWRKIHGPKLVEVTGWKDCIMSVIICTVTKFYVGDQLKEDEMGRSCGICGRERNTGFW